MNREKHIREMSDLIYENRPIKDIWNEEADSIAETLYNAGYRKQSENAVEVVRCKDCNRSRPTDTLILRLGGETPCKVS